MSYTWDYLQANPKEAKRRVGISYEQLTQLISNPVECTQYNIGDVQLPPLLKRPTQIRGLTNFHWWPQAAA